MLMLNGTSKIIPRYSRALLAMTFASLALANSAQESVRDHDSNRMTPGDQGTSPQDVEMTRNIRKEILAQKGMSMSGQNVKIVTFNLLVTLRGPVATTEEKKLIYDIACRLAGSDKVTDEMEVK